MGVIGMPMAIPWALLDRDGGPAILDPPQALKAAWMARMAGLAVATADSVQ